ncbi:YsnF/AvaK domain-containing protein [Geomonas sp. RF6]|uniref:YsnF/AvaK domain-containing protein n=1 Tax=Geomonas sp. RF6 TaxID=2897342 RepID=UPI001E44E881|nr:YsnF/AvaK domain-containing protein [Geomonas sp. RF6]UFS71900.1 YsnF/AvaK domain-containing protein [Geomonas sp. RF6]
MAKTVVGLMDSMRQAHEVVRELESTGFEKGSINLIGSHRGTGTESGTLTGTTRTGQGLDETRTTAAERGTTGAPSGAYESGLTPTTIPGIGPALHRGSLGSDLSGGGLGPLVKMGVPEQDAHYYMEGVKRGGVMVAVTCPDDRVPQASSIMQNHGAIDIDRTAEHWKREGWTGFHAEGYEHTAQARSGHQEARVLPVAEETVKVGKREVSEGFVRVYTHVESVPIQENVSLREEHATIERRPVDRPISGADREAFRESSVEVREMREEPVVSKEARVKEEVLVGKDSTQRMETVHETARQTKVEVERGQQTGRGSGTAPHDEDEDFRRHYQSLYSSKGDYDTYRSAYHYGEDPEMMQLRGREWSEVEEDVHRSWDKKHPGGTWSQFKDAIRYGWDKKRRT